MRLPVSDGRKLCSLLYGLDTLDTTDVVTDRGVRYARMPLGRQSRRDRACPTARWLGLEIGLPHCLHGATMGLLDGLPISVSFLADAVSL